MPAPEPRHIDTWVFDLDHTLYPPQARLFAQIEARMNAFIVTNVGVSEGEATILRERYWADHGTTLAGLMHHHGIAPDAFLEDVHRIDLSPLTPDPALAAAIAALPGRKIVFTNGPRAHAERVTRARGLTGLFETLYGVEDAGFVSKPHAPAYDAVFGLAGLTPTRAAMVEDDPRNLAIPHARGMRTVLVHPADAPPQLCDHIHHSTADLTGYLTGFVSRLGGLAGA